MKKFHLGLCALALAGFACAKEVKIGVVLPLTGSVAAYGQDVLMGIELANKFQAKLKNGDDVKLVVLDSKGDKVESATAATRLVSADKVLALIGEAVTPNTMQVISVAESKKIPMIAPVASGDKLLNGKKYSSRVCFMDSFQGQKFADYAFNTLNLKTAVLITDQSNVYSLGLSKVFEQSFTQKGGKILKKFNISSNDKDFKAIVSQLQGINADFVYMPIYHPEAALIAKQARAAGFKGLLAAGDGVNNKTFIELGGSAVNGVVFTDSFDYNNPPNQISKSFLDLYAKEKGTRELPAFSAMGADAYLVVLEAMNKCETNLTSECINNEIHSITNFQSVGGTININKSGNASRSVVVKEIQNEKQTYKATINP
ncbi:branched-chain amino acid ABC transporter substrate-binding protein [Campylobacter sp. MIT 99-7217]|uniref:ABC transporter substrate-binding protein n=1 Tax=Campylobacter sp. MIT 99-7217 TaxID=535091 RepID=UPI00115B4D18|nr:ABC transporter substrate-binding protein [Campylobacter sp. MIT 99-7217]TQR33715.1 branched-chain amino acid ABC transporter substrate-binding protein [Campylobacter sp. MIT 99-7217]